MVAYDPEQQNPGARNEPGTAEEDEVVIEVPFGVQPGITKLGVKLDSGLKRLVATVPKNALPGDQLVFRKDSKQQWSCSLGVVAPRLDEGTNGKSQLDGGDDGEKPTVPAMPAPQMQEANGVIAAFIPSGVIAGQTVIAVDKPESQKCEPAGDGAADDAIKLAGKRPKKIGITVPPTALPGDKVLITDGEGGLEVSVVKERLQQSDRTSLEEHFKKISDFSAPAMDAKEVFIRMAAAARQAGGFVSEKIMQAAVPPLNIPGLAAKEPIAEGEELIRMPKELHISPDTPDIVTPMMAKEVDDNESVGSSLKDKAKLALFVGALIRRAEERAAGVEQQKLTPPLPGCETVSAEVFAVWEAYADGLLGVSFDTHPVRIGPLGTEAFLESLEPSPQGDLTLDMASEMQGSFEALQSAGPTAVASHSQDFRHWLQARLCILSRVFEAHSSFTLVPVVDLMNHAVKPGVIWKWSAEHSAMIATAGRAHEVGEELLVSYGDRSSELLFQTYGFTLPPDIEPSWSFELRAERARSIYDAFMPPEKAQHLILFETERIDDTLETAIQAVHRHGQKAEDFLMLSCAKALASLESDPAISKPLLALRTVRAKDPQRSDWWTELAQEDAACVDDTNIRIKMGEVLCLVAHIEALSVNKGSMPPLASVRCVETLRHLLSNALLSVRT